MTINTRVLAATIIAVTISCGAAKDTGVYNSVNNGSQPFALEAVESAFREAGIPYMENRRDAADFTLSVLTGEEASLESFKGSVVILYFWTTWCPSCIAGMPALQVLNDRFKNQGLTVLAVNIQESIETVESFIKSNNYKFTIMLDNESRVAYRYGINAIPTTYILDRQGRIVSSYLGGKNWENTKNIAALEALLNE